MLSWTRSKFMPSPRFTEEVDFLNLCEDTAHAIEELINSSGQHLLNRRQCRDLSRKLLETVENSRGIVLRIGASPDLFNPALGYLYLHLEKAKLLVSSCAEEDWCAAAVFQIQNENAFREILIGTGLCYNVIYEQANSWSWSHLKDLRKSSTFLPASASDVHGDEEELQRWLEEYVNVPCGVILTAEEKSKAAKRASRLCLARYLLVKLKYKREQSQTNSFDGCSAILWTKEPGLPEPWTNSHFLGSGTGANGVCSIEWLGIPCAKKLFYHQEHKPIFTKEAAILAGLQHPCIVNFICCGNGQQKGDCFIATELMEKNLFDLIEEQRNNDEPFPLPVVVDMMVQMARGMLYLHGRHVAHRDLKPQNVVVKRLTIPHLHANYYGVKLVDFGLSKTKIEVSKSITISLPGTGTRRYRAPEVFPNAHRPTNGPKINWFKVDTYSFAITCAHLLTLKQPFENLSNMYDELLSGTRPELPTNCPEELVSLLTDCWDINPRLRPHFRDILLRLENFHHKLLRGLSPGDEKEITISTASSEFVSSMMELQCSSNKDGILHDRTENDAAEGEVREISTIEEDIHETCIAEELVAQIDGDKVVSIITCTRNHALVLLTKSAYKGKFNCNICREPGTGGVYHCKTCEFDAHPDCAEVKEKVTVSFRQALLRLELQTYHKSNLDAATCGFCQEPLEDREWVYKSTSFFYAHVLCTKYPAEMKHHRFPEQVLTLAKSPPTGKLCTCCHGSIKGYYYTCLSGAALQQCSFDLHPFCAIRPAEPHCSNDTAVSHQLSLVTDQYSFQCGQCETSRSSWHYHCIHCGVDKCLDCLENTEEDDDWNLAFETFMSKCYAKSDVFVWNNIKAEMISNLVDGLSIRVASAPAAMKICPKVKAKSRLPEHEPKLKNVEDLELYVLRNLQHCGSNLSAADSEFLAASLEKLQLHRAHVISLSDATDP